MPTSPRRVGVIGAGHVGSIAALQLDESDLFDEVVLVDLLEGLAAGIALDLSHDAGIDGNHTRVTGTADMSALAGSEYVILTAGRPRQPGMSRTDLTAVNAEIVGSIAEQIATYAPDSVIVLVSNPLEEMTHLAQLRSGFPPERVIGMAGLLDTARFKSLVALTGICTPGEVEAYALGSHGPEMVVPLSLATANGTLLSDQLPAEELAAIVERTRNSGGEVVALLETGSAYFAPGHAAAEMVKVMASGSDRVIPCAVDPQGAYGIKDTRVGVPVRLGPHGVAEIVELDLTDDELADLRSAADRLRERIAEVS